MATFYRSKIDWWLLAVLLVAIGLSLWSAIETLSRGTVTAWIYAAVIAMVGAVLPLWLVLSTHYTLGDGELLVRSGPLKWRIRVADITSVTETSNPLSSPALSLDRLCIQYGHYETLMISPRDKPKFITDLEVARQRVQPN